MLHLCFTRHRRLARLRVLTLARGGCRCNQVHIPPREALTLGLDWCAASTLLVVGRRRCSRLTRRVGRRDGGALALARTRRLLTPPAEAMRTRTRTEGRRQQSPCRFGDVYSNRRGFPLSSPNTPGNEPVFDTSARERVTAHLRLLERVCWSSRTHTEAVGAAKCSPRHGKPSRSA